MNNTHGLFILVLLVTCVITRNCLLLSILYKIYRSSLTLCESCTDGKQIRKGLQSEKRADLPLGLVHSDLCGKINEKSLSGAEYFFVLY